MVIVDINLYDTDGIPLFREGELIPWSEVGMTYEDIDKLGVWLLMNKRGKTVTLAMRIDRMLSGGRENRRILVLRIGYEHEDELDRVVDRFPDIIERFLKSVEEKGISSYQGPLRTETKWDYLAKYISRTGKILRAFRGKVRMKLPYLNYSEPSISERGDILKFFLYLSRNLGDSTFLGIFSKSSSVSPSGVWICGDGKPVEELEAKIEAARLKKRRTKPAEKAEKNNATIVYSIGAFILGALLVLGLVFAGILGGSAPKSEGAVIVPAEKGEINSIIKAIDKLPGDEGRLMEGYLAFANSTEEVNMTELLKLVQKDITLYEDYHRQISLLNRTNENLTRQLDKSKKEVNTLNKRLNLLNQSISGFSTESRYFALLFRNKNVTLNPDDLKNLSKKPGIEGWTNIMRGKCMGEAKQEAHRYIGDLNNLNKTLSLYSAVLQNISQYLTQMNSSKVEVFRQSRKKIDERRNSIPELQKEINKSLKGIKTCRDAYLMEENWSKTVGSAENIKGLYSDALKLVLDVKEKGTNSTIMKDKLLDYAINQKGITKEEIQKKINNLFTHTKGPLELFQRFEELLRWIMEGGK